MSDVWKKRGWFTFSTTCSDGNAVSLVEQLVVDDGVVDFGLKDMIEALSAQLLACLGSLEDGSYRLTQVAWVPERLY